MDDAAIDAALVCGSIGTWVPIAITGTSPNGSLADFRFIRAGYADGGCTAAYGIELVPAPDADCTVLPTLSFIIPAPFEGTSLQVLVTHNSPVYITTNQATFEAIQLDEPTVPAPRIYGSLVSHDPAWM